MRKESIFKIGIFIALITILSKILGLVRDQVITAFFGASLVTDTYLAVNNLTGLILVTFGGVGGAFHLAVMKTISSARAGDNIGSSAKGVWNFGILSLGFSVLATLLLYYFALPITSLLLPGLHREGILLAAGELQVMSPLIIFTVLMGIMTGILNAYHRTLIISINTAVANLVFILYILLFKEKSLTLTLAWGALWSTVGQWLVMMPAFIKTKFPVRLSLNPIDAKPLMEMFFPMILGSAVGIINVYIDTAFASTLKEPGNITALNLAARLYILPLGIVLSALLLPLFPIFSELAAVGRFSEFRQRLDGSIILLILMVLPISSFFIVMAEPMVSILFHRGSFTEESTKLTSYVLICFSTGMIFYVLRDLMTRIFYALGDSRTPLKVAMISIFLNILLDALLIGPFGIGGIALATVGVNGFNLVTLLLILKRKNPELILFRSQLPSVYRIMLVTAIMTVLIACTWLSIGRNYQDSGIIEQILLVSSVFCLGLVFYVFAAYTSRIPLLVEGVDRIRNRFKKLHR